MPVIKPTCRSGHPRNAQNTYVQPNGDLICRVCRKATHKKWRHARRQAAGFPKPRDLTLNQCRNGHPRTEANTKLRKSGAKECLTCRSMRLQKSTPTAGSQSGFTCKETTNHVDHLQD